MSEYWTSLVGQWRMCSQGWGLMGPELLNVRHTALVSTGYSTPLMLCVSGLFGPLSFAIPIIHIVLGPIRGAFAKRCCGVHSR